MFCISVHVYLVFSTFPLLSLSKKIQWKYLALLYCSVNTFTFIRSSAIEKNHYVFLFGKMFILDKYNKTKNKIIREQIHFSKMFSMYSCRSVSSRINLLFLSTLYLGLYTKLIIICRVVMFLAFLKWCDLHLVGYDWNKTYYKGQDDCDYD